VVATTFRLTEHYRSEDILMNAPDISLTPSVFTPVAIGFFGLAVGYFVWGGQALFGFPKDTPEVNRTMGLWGFLMPGFMQFITGVYLTVGLTWFGVFDKDPPLYMAAVAFTTYGIYWFATAYRRYVGASSEPDAWMAIPFLLLSILGTMVSAAAGSNAVAILFIGVALVYATEIPTRFGVFRGQRLIGLWQVLTGIWLIYLTYGTVFNIALGRHWWA
jgi:hypothetical protein